MYGTYGNIYEGKISSGIRAGTDLCALGSDRSQDETSVL